MRLFHYQGSYFDGASQATTIHDRKLEGIRPGGIAAFQLYGQREAPIPCHGIATADAETCIADTLPPIITQP